MRSGEEQECGRPSRSAADGAAVRAGAEKGHRGSARVLGIDHSKVAGCMEGGRMSWRVREALERRLGEGGGRSATW